MHVLVVDFVIRPEHAADFQDAISANAKASLAREPGCRQFDVCIDPADPTRVFLYELYDGEAAVQAHLASNHFAEMSRLTADWVERKSVRRLVLAGL
jgi:autoinducer 2-degrading protein